MKVLAFCGNKASSPMYEAIKYYREYRHKVFELNPNFFIASDLQTDADLVIVDSGSAEEAAITAAYEALEITVLAVDGTVGELTGGDTAETDTITLPTTTTTTTTTPAP